MSFSVFQFHPHITAAIKTSGYASPTPIQQQAIPPVLAGRDVLGLAQTGTGKTAAFVLPILQRCLQHPRKGVQALVIAPTRELAEQIHEYFARMAAGTRIRSAVIYGGVSKSVQARKLREGVEIIVACPGRLLDHLQDRAVDLRHVEMLVLDEADHMFDKGFLPDIRRIIKQVPQQRQTLVFSATMPREVRHLVEDILDDAVTVQIDHQVPLDTVSHSIFQVEQTGKSALLQEILHQPEIRNALVFTRTKHKARSLAQVLDKAGFKATALQGNMSQPKRQQALEGFKRGTYTIMVATDIAARGIDVSGLSHVINFDMPDTFEAYTHRTGRTGRATCVGDALTFATGDDTQLVRQIQKTLGDAVSIKKIARPTRQPAVAVEAVKKVSPVAPVNGGDTRGKTRRGRARSFDFGL
jgi:superfamily II DNA/RNA helicase